MGFLKKIGKGLKKVVKKVGKVVGSVAQIAGPIVSMIPGIGTAVGVGLTLAGGLLGPKPKEVAASPPQAVYAPEPVYASAPLAAVAPGAVPAQLPAPVMAAAGFSPMLALGLAALFLLKR